MDKEEKYKLLLKQLQALVVENIPVSGNICNLLAQMQSEMGYFWCGLYIKQPNNTLGLGPFQGLPACTLIQWGKGVCGTAASTGEVQIVDDVSLFPGYIACHAETRSEIVVPGFINNEVAFVLDVDSIEKGYFNDIDKKYLILAAEIMSDILKQALKARPAEPFGRGRNLPTQGAAL